MSEVTRDGAAEPVSRDQILRRERDREKKPKKLSSADHKKDWHPYPADPCPAENADHTKNSTIYRSFYSTSEFGKEKLR